MPEKSTTALIAEIHTDLKWVVKSLDKKASKWVEHVLKILMAGTALWLIGQILDLIPKIQTAYIYLNYIT